MISMWEYREDVLFSDAGIVGYDVEARDGGIGKVDEASLDAGSSFVVVDTGWWIFGKKRLVPAGLIERLDDAEKKVYLRMTKDEVKDAPDFDADHRDRRDEYENYYQPYGWN